MIREIQASDAKARFLRILDEVERGETVIITRRGRPIARLAPEPERRQQEMDEAIANLKALRQRTGKTTIKELKATIHEGHKH
jgi:prevent-host-death family protein